MSLSNADILAIKVMAAGVQKTRQDLAQIQTDLKNLTKSQTQQISVLNKFKAALKGLGDAHENHSRSTEGVVGRYHRLAAVFGTVAAAAGTVYKAVKAFEDLQSFRQGLAFNIGAGNAKSVESQLRGFGNKTGLSAFSLIPELRGLAGTGEVKAQDLLPTLRAFTALGKRQGTSNTDIEGAFTQYKQVAMAGKLQGDELRIIQERGVNLRRLLKDAGLGDRIGGAGGNNSNGLTFQEIQKVLLQFGKSAEAEKYLSIGSNNATSSLNRLKDVLNFDILPILGRVLTPEVAALADELRKFVTSIPPATLEQFGHNLGSIMTQLGQMAITLLPLTIQALPSMLLVVRKVVDAFTKLNDLTSGKLIKALGVIAGYRLVKGGLGSLAGGAIGNAAGGATAIGWIWKMGKVIFTAISGIALLADAAGGLAALLTTDIAVAFGAAASSTVALTAAVVAAGAAIGAAVGWILNMLPNTKFVQNLLVEGYKWASGINKAESEAAKPAGNFSRGSIERQQYFHDIGKSDPANNRTATSLRRSDPQRMITEGVGNGLRYALS